MQGDHLSITGHSLAYADLMENSRRLMGVKSEPACVSLGPYDISLLDAEYLTKNPCNIIESTHLFWLAFCKTYAQFEELNFRYFTVSLYDREVTVSGSEYLVSGVQGTVEIIRKIFERGYHEKRGFCILPIDLGSSIYIREKTEGCIDLKDWLSDGVQKVCKHFYRCNIEPVIVPLCESLGTSYSSVVVDQEVITGSHEFDKGMMTVSAFQLDWKGDSQLMYPITAKKNPQRDMQDAIYSLFQSKTLCDLTLETKNGDLQVHSIPFFTNGGEVFQSLLTSGMKESVEKKIDLTTYSLATVMAFTDFIYLGEKAFTPESFLDRELDLCELFEMANTYQIQPLIDCCTNLFSLFSSEIDIDQIKYLGVLYNNEHLKQLYTHISKEEATPTENMLTESEWNSITDTDSPLLEIDE